MKALTDVEAAYLRELRAMEKKNEQFDHRGMCRRFGWKSVYSSWDVMTRLQRKGFIKRGERLALVESPVVTPAGKVQLGELPKSLPA